MTPPPPPPPPAEPAEETWTPPPWCAVDRQLLVDLARDFAVFMTNTDNKIARLTELGGKTYEQACKTNGDVRALYAWKREMEGRMAIVTGFWHFISHDRRVLIPLTFVLTWVAGHLAFDGSPLW